MSWPPPCHARPVDHLRAAPAGRAARLCRRWWALRSGGPDAACGAGLRTGGALHPAAVDQPLHRAGGRDFEAGEGRHGRPIVRGARWLLLTITSEANHARLADLQRDAQRVADPRGAAPGEIDAAVRRLPAIVWLAHSVHGGEASGVEAGLGLLYQLAAGTDDETRLALDSTVVLMIP
ncbi:MAG: hypothetical protein IPK33_08925, partial [Gemmatimonadetes bacterium]|nr:hypothetical protein [Gemmatimonadota bacterium]